MQIADARKVREVIIRVNEEEAKEIVSALFSKAWYVTRGEYGPEEEPGSDARWIADLERLAELVQDALSVRS